MARNLDKLEAEAAELLRSAARGPWPDAGIVGQLMQVVRDARKQGYEDAATELADAYVLYIVECDDLDKFRDALTERLPADWAASRPVVRGQVWIWRGLKVLITRIARNGSWADIKVYPENRSSLPWTKRQKLPLGPDWQLTSEYIVPR